MKILNEELLTMSQATDVLKTTRPTLYRWLRSGRLSGHKVGRQWRFKRSELERFSQGTAPTIDLPANPTSLLQALRNGLQNPGPALDDPMKEAFNLMLMVGVAKDAESLCLGTYLTEEDSQKECWLRYRVDGVLQPFTKIDPRLQPHLLEYWKQMSGCDVREKSLPQDGRLVMPASPNGPSRTLDVRVSFLTSKTGEDMTARIFDSRKTRQKVSELDLPQPDLERILLALNRRASMVVVCDIDENAKSNMVAACLRELAGPSRSIYSVVDSTEPFVPWTTTVSRWLGDRYHDCTTIIRGVLRSSPDVVCLSNLSDKDGMTGAREATLKGPLVVAGMNADGCVPSLHRLLDLAGSVGTLAQTLSLICSQRRIRKLCPNCAEPAAVESLVRTKLLEVTYVGGLSESAVRAKFNRAVGCACCGYSGYVGRSTLIETVYLTPLICRLLESGASNEELQEAAVGQGMISLQAQAAELARRGLTSLEELKRFGVALI